MFIYFPKNIIFKYRMQLIMMKFVHNSKACENNVVVLDTNKMFSKTNRGFVAADVAYG